jgi:hypothetical protein
MVYIISGILAVNDSEGFLMETWFFRQLIPPIQAQAPSATTIFACSLIS